ncbi:MULTISPECIES: sugar transferase [Pseudoalteromonas]|uniref:Sugar transferase n=1 Tax=Pseudoalteromonas rubra TaxID=43658 RepID=A0A5S3V550_9GAMM|nr:MULTISPECIES: sugar transferase [Pseudoalteromonas]MCG7562501.1 sugar transferase [Pseudoalteromonas sp. McH1-42]MEC4089943.1 sugar transferase [Pseudoalteromonas rubra]QPB84627.1 sugar transferase [Pseudoalteromonas rubra]
MKRLFDLVSSLIGLVLLFPVFIITAVLIKKDGGSAFYLQDRVGLNGKTFKLYKFRSMVANADKIGGYSTQVGDPRITKIGKFIRRTSIDELPQLLNVLKGDMSVVGPRPNVPQQVKEYTAEDWQLRNSVKPGITGLAQVMYRSSATMQQRLELDLDYAKRSNLILDIKLVLLTVKQVIVKGGY